MYDQSVVDVPASFRLPDDLFDRLFRHARIVLERHLRDGVALVNVPHDTDEARHPPDLGIAAAQRRDLRAHVEIGGLYPDGHMERAAGNGPEGVRNLRV